MNQPSLKMRIKITIVDGEKMVEMFETLELGLKSIKTYEIDEKFFDEFKS